MKKNMGGIDKAIRILIGVVVVILAITKVLTGTSAIILLILSGIFIITSMMSICPLYIPLRISTIKTRKK